MTALSAASTTSIRQSGRGELEAPPYYFKFEHFAEYGAHRLGQLDGQEHWHFGQTAAYGCWQQPGHRRTTYERRAERFIRSGNGAFRRLIELSIEKVRGAQPALQLGDPPWRLYGMQLRKAEPGQSTGRRWPQASRSARLAASLRVGDSGPRVATVSVRLQQPSAPE